MRTIAVIGSKKSGKTTTIEALVKGLVNEGYSVATVKHVSEAKFSVDTEGKDTWRHANAGAQTVAIVASHEITIIRKIATLELNFEEIAKYCCFDSDFLVLEGFRDKIKQDSSVPKIVAIKVFDEASEALKKFHPILAFTGSAALKAKKLGKPVVDVLREPEKLLNIILSWSLKEKN